MDIRSSHDTSATRQDKARGGRSTSTPERGKQVCPSVNIACPRGHRAGVCLCSAAWARGGTRLLNPLVGNRHERHSVPAREPRRYKSTPCPRGHRAGAHPFYPRVGNRAVAHLLTSRVGTGQERVRYGSTRALERPFTLCTSGHAARTHSVGSRVGNAVSAALRRCGHEGQPREPRGPHASGAFGRARSGLPLPPRLCSNLSGARVGIGVRGLDFQQPEGPKATSPGPGGRQSAIYGQRPTASETYRVPLSYAQLSLEWARAPGVPASPRAFWAGTALEARPGSAMGRRGVGTP